MNPQEQRLIFKKTWETAILDILKSVAQKSEFPLDSRSEAELIADAPLLIERLSKEQCKNKKNKTQWGFFSGANGVGKNTVLAKVITALNATKLPYAYTRSRRADEIDGIDYYFWSDEQFDRALKNNEYIWYSLNHHGKKQGLLKKDLLDKLQSGKPFVLDARVLTTQYLVKNVSEVKSSNFVSFYILPPSFDEWYRRLVTRSSSSPSEDVVERINISLEELKKAGSVCEVFIVNDVIERAVQEIANFYQK